MIVAGTQVLLALSVLTGSWSWPGGLETDGRALADLGQAQRLSTDAKRLSAIDRLVAAHGTDAATPFLVPLLADREASVRLYVGRLLARAGSPAAVTAAVAWIQTPAVPLIDRVFGLDVLGQAVTLSATARSAIEQAVRDPEAAIRLRALEALEQHPVGPSLSVVLGALDDDNRDVRLRAVRLAGTVGDPRAALPLLDRLDDGDRPVRLQAIAALGRLANLRAAPALLRVASEGTTDERTAAIDALGALKAAVAAAPLAALARRRSDDVGRHAALALGEIGTPAAVAALVAALRSPPVADEVVMGLGHAGVSAVTALMGEIERGTPSSAGLAMRILGDLGDRRATLPICAAVERRSEGAALNRTSIPIPIALEALARLADPASVPTLTRLAESPEAEIRRGAFVALLSVADPRSFAVLDAGLGDPEAAVRVLAARLAARIGARAAAPALAARIADGDAPVRQAAAEALARVADGATRLLTPVLAALIQPDAPPRDDEESAALGDALESLAGASDADQLARAFVTARGGTRVAIARGLAVAYRAGPASSAAPSDARLLDRLLAAVGEGGPTALAAADALAVMRIGTGAVATLARAFGDAEPMVRARLCPAIAGTPEGGGWLAALIAAPDESAEVRAAAAWSARGHPETHAALEIAARGDDAVARNARAALLALRPSSGSGWAVVRLLGPDGAPLMGRWVTIGEPGGRAVAAMTDSFGVARVMGLSGGSGAGGPLDLRAAGFTLRDGP